MSEQKGLGTIIGFPKLTWCKSDSQKLREIEDLIPLWQHDIITDQGFIYKVIGIVNTT